MTKHQVYHALNRLLTILHRSLPMYLTYASPWTRRGDERAVKTLAHIVEDQRQLATRVAQQILRIGPIELGEYPIDFLDTHDLSLEYLLVKLIECQKKDIKALEDVASALAEDRQAAGLAEEALGAARGHLESLEELLTQPARNEA